MRNYLFYIILLCHFTISAQDNLVPNYSFENYSACPTSPNALSNATDWYTCNNESPDYFNSCQLMPNTYGVPFTIYGYQPARTGQAYTGLFVYGGSVPHREYLQVQLTAALKEDTDYKISFYVNLSDNSSVAISNMGAYLSGNAVGDTISGALPYTPQVTAAAGSFAKDTAAWVKISGTFTAAGGERFITIGNFKDDASTDTLQLNTLPAFSYYYIDDISVVQSDSSAEAGNIFTPNEDGLNDDWIIRNLPKNSQIKIYDRWGVMVGGVENPEGIQGTFKWDGRTSSGERCKNGVYFFVVTTSGEGSTGAQKGFIQLIR
jgi:gliding motility-associated-like protein